jgi:hypothetical protein
MTVNPWTFEVVNPPPEGGLCQTAEDKDPWLEPPRSHKKSHKPCRGCPVLLACQAFSANQLWSGVVIANWSAPASKHGGSYPPWAPRRQLDAKRKRVKKTLW